ncbi:hypothetical protein MBLNU457_g2592t1 [Dothideomycetes sp. NU457]
MIFPSTAKVGAFAALLASSANAAAIDKRNALNPYAPYPALCPSGSLNRAASGLNPNEANYIASRKPKADAALKAWLTKTNPAFLNGSTTLPTLAFGGSGGGYRALLNEAGVIQAFDARDSNSTVAGLYQALTYEAALSGGGWRLASTTGENWPTISYLRDNIWAPSLQNGLLMPDQIGDGDIVDYATITADVMAKALSGYPVSLTDPYGRLLGYSLFDGADGGVGLTLSGLTSNSNFTSFNVPFPIFTSIGQDVTANGCTLLPNSSQYEFTPYEFGSWDKGVSAFTNVKYLGSTLVNGKPLVPGFCTLGFDNLGWVAGTTGDIFPSLCSSLTTSGSSTLSTANSTGNDLTALVPILEEAIAPLTPLLIPELFSQLPNPFYKSSTSPTIAKMTQLAIGDGGLSGQADPIWPYIQPSGRRADVLFMADVGQPEGQNIYNTYLAAQAAGLSRMPTIPSTATIQATGLANQATFFGCYEPNAMTIVWLPLVSYTYPSNTSTYTLQYNTTDTDGIIGNGNAIGTQNGTLGWNTCVACAVMLKSGSALPVECGACFEKYCYKS